MSERRDVQLRLLPCTCREWPSAPGEGVRALNIAGAFAALAAGVATLGPDGRIVEANPAHAQSVILIAVCDTGRGLTPESVDHLFDYFYTTKRNSTGMGLSISQSIIEAHGGRRWATPNLTRGATFHITRPAVQGVPSHDAGTDRFCG